MTQQDLMKEQDQRLKEKMPKIKNKLIVMSGKGGVGKTSVAVNLSYALASFGREVGLLDVDLHGPNIAKMLGIEQASLYTTDLGIEPVEVTAHLKAVSLALTGMDCDRPVIWRGPMKNSAIRQFLSDVNWGVLDYLIVDSPPGTGDEPLSVCQLIPGMTGAVIVTTPQDVAVLDARKSVLFAKELNIPVIGVIENMSGFMCPHCRQEVDIFKRGGGQKAAEELNVPFLGRVPLDPELVVSADSGKPFVSFKGESAAAKAFIEVVRKIEASLSKGTI
ncbi:MAG TPA: Mrp/NBP35 family ATP-binding protein [Candidatus Omnitrophota bacterium]|jgi:Mrp family chromosome partitioning ATPase|nr:Mrp/NBP35 family ATP-binding protein [Candidatus Omnitrophota bacterium]HPN55587.1 Mrp/NBP35 family ATP-binding protein [Candidatus Omnitrophota bacterium]